MSKLWVAGATGFLGSHLVSTLAARGHEVVHLLRPHDARPHRLSDDAEMRDGKLYLCGRVVA